MKSLFALCISAALLVPVVSRESAAQGTKEQINKLHQDPKAYIAMLESPQRTKEQKPDEVIAAMNLKAGETLVDIGAGSGFFSFRFSPKVGDSGRVFAVDVDPEMIRHMNRVIRDRKLKNVSTVLSDPQDPLLPNVPVNRFFICNTFHHIQSRPQYIAIMKRMLKPGGQIIIVDYKKKQLPVGPPPEMKLAKKEVIGELESGGFKLVKEHDFLEYQYFLVFETK